MGYANGSLSTLLVFLYLLQHSTDTHKYLIPIPTRLNKLNLCLFSSITNKTTKYPLHNQQAKHQALTTMPNIALPVSNLVP